MGFFLSIAGCQITETPASQDLDNPRHPEIYLTILGVTQDAGFPQIDCKEVCCQQAWEDVSLRRMPVCLGITDAIYEQNWLVEATPHMKDQWQTLNKINGFPVSGILITHAHAGHYTGLMQLGREMLGAAAMPVYGLPSFCQFLENNGPWDQLVRLENIRLIPVLPDSSLVLSSNLSCIPFLVPHRDEYSQTAGFLIKGPRKTVLFIPDIDKWGTWSMNIKDLITSVDYAILDGTFFRAGEIKNRDMSEIPHPFIEETVDLLSSLTTADKKKVFFIHFNHTNPLLSNDPESLLVIKNAGMQVAEEGMILSL